MMNQGKLKPYVYSWVEKGIVDQETAAAILKLYPERGYNYWKLAFVIIGSLLLLAGVILIVASNWEQLADEAKLLGMLLLLGGSGSLSIEWQRRGCSPAFWESSYLMATTFPLLGMMLISQIFHLYGDPTGLFFTWALVIAPIPLLSKSVSSWVIFVIAVFSVIIAFLSHQEASFAYWCLLTMVLG
ncbi:MAG: DUF2157 domain-containing protein, partial [Verrucomicrobiota bacterium]